jgi:exoribonuclease II
MSRPDLAKVPEWYHRYINQVEEDDLVTALSNQTKSFNKFLDSIPEEKINHRYAEGKWTVKEVLQHIIDAERVFAYRALRFARMDNSPLPGFDENSFVENSKTGKRNWNDLIAEFNVVRQSTEILFRSFDDEQLQAIGTASGNPINVQAIGFIIAGHGTHHVNVVKERYL